MAIGVLYEVPESAEGLFQRIGRKSEWYEAMQAAGVETAPCCDAEDSLRAWEYAISRGGLETAVGRLFLGDLRSEDEDNGDPACVFHRGSSVEAIASDLDHRGSQFFATLLSEPGWQADTWLFPRLLSFMAEAAQRKAAVIVLWER